MPASLTEKAVAIIDAAPAHGPLRPLAYAEALPPEAADLAHVLRQPAISEVAARYAAADAAAVHAQRRANVMAWCAAAAGFLAAALSGLLFYLNALGVPHDVELAVSALQVAALAVSLAGSSLLTWRKPFGAWRAERGAAEAARVDLFSRLVAAPAPTETPGAACCCR
ncbi:MAG TPA: hypothetical protein VFZ16_19165 [Hyphomicrobiaceae bacterium]|nr:hypothetical protein [Hyphomicrobiaceae bacterium]